MHTLVNKKRATFFKGLRDQMRSRGFVHITGLHWTNTMTNEEGIVRPKRETYTRWSHDEEQNATIAILENGEVWMRYAEMDDNLRNFLRRVCRKGKGAITTLPDVFVIGDRQLMDRYHNFNSSRYYSPVPHPF